MEREEADVVMENGGVEGTREGTGRKNGIWQRKKRSSNQHDGMDPPIAHHHHHYHHSSLSSSSALSNDRRCHSYS